VARPIRFFSEKGELSEFSNFAPCGFEEDGKYWPTVEHYFQAQKFKGKECEAHRERIRKARSPREAKQLGQSRKFPLRGDWECVKENIMRHALRKKFEDPRLRELLLSTGNRPLIEASPYDDYWGEGRDGRGRNRLGVLLVELRAELRAPSRRGKAP
jgi:hypothetical protein